MKTRILSIILILGISLSAQAQDTDLQYRMFAKQSENCVKLKIVPQKADDWIGGIDKGYDIYRREVGQDAFTKLNDAPVKPWTKEQIREAYPQIADSLYAFQEESVLDRVPERKAQKGMFEAVKYFQEIDNNYALYFLLSTRVKEISASSGLEYKDYTTETGKTYVYHAKLAYSELTIADTYIVTDGSSPHLPFIDGKQGDLNIDLAWYQSANSMVVGYYLERSFEGSGFKRLHEEPLYMNVSKDSLYHHHDTLDYNYRPYTYRLIGVDIWAEETQPSLEVSYNGIDLTPPALPDSIWLTENKEQKSLTLKWAWQNQPDDLERIMAYWSATSDGYFTPLHNEPLGADSRIFTKDTLTPGANQYFQLVVIDSAGNHQASSSVYGYLPDSYPPDQPNGLNAEIDSLGVVTINWELGSNEPLTGYAVYRSNGEKLRFIHVSGHPIKENYFIDTVSLHRLNKESYYKVRAIDKSFNYSEFSEPLKVVIRDTINPAPAYLKDIEYTNGQLRFSWIKSVSQDVAEQMLFELNEEGDTVRTVSTIPAADSTMSLSWSESGSFTFALVVLDEAGNASELSLPTSVRVIENEQAILVEKAKAKRSGDGILISWNAPDLSGLSYRIYRRDASGKSDLIGQTSESSLSDPTQLVPGEYQYLIFIIDEKGIRADQAQVVEYKSRK